MAPPSSAKKQNVEIEVKKFLYYIFIKVKTFSYYRLY